MRKTVKSASVPKMAFISGKVRFIELELLRRNEEPEPRRATTVALDRLRSWEIRLFDLEPLQRGYAVEFSRKLIRKGYLSETEFNDGLILAEVAIKEIEVLVTMDHHLLDIEFTALQAELKDAGFYQTVVFCSVGCHACREISRQSSVSLRVERTGMAKN